MRNKKLQKTRKCTVRYLKTGTLLPQVHIKPCAMPHLCIDCILVYTGSSLVPYDCWGLGALRLFFCSSMCSCDYISAWLGQGRDRRLGEYLTCHRFINKDGFKCFSCYACVIINVLFLSLFFFLLPANQSNRRWTAFWWVFLISRWFKPDDGKHSTQVNTLIRATTDDYFHTRIDRAIITVFD